MGKHIGKIVVVFLILCYLSALFFYAIQFPYFIGWDGAMRAVWTDGINDVVKSFFRGKYHSLSDIYNHTIAFYMDHYAMPLYFIVMMNHLFILIICITTLLFGFNYFTLAIPNAVMFVLALIYLYKLTMLIYKDRLTAWLSVGLTATFPFVFNAVFGLDRGMGEMMFVTATLYYLIKFYETDEIKNAKYAFITLTLGFLFREAILVMYVPFFIIFFIKEKSILPAWKKYRKPILQFMIITIIVFGCLAGMDYFVNRFGFHGIFTSRLSQTTYYYQEKSDIEGLLTLEKFMQGNAEWKYNYQTPNSLPLYKILIFLLSILFYNPLILFLGLVYVGNVILFKSFDKRQGIIWIIILLYIIMLTLHDVIPEYTPPIYILLSVFIAYAISRLLSLIKKNLMRISIGGAVIFLLLGYNIIKFGFMPDRSLLSSKENLYDNIVSAILEEEKNMSENYSVFTDTYLLRNVALSFLLNDTTRKVHVVRYDKISPSREDWNIFFSSPFIITKLGRHKPPVKYAVTLPGHGILEDQVSDRNDFKPLRKVKGFLRIGWLPLELEAMIYVRENHYKN